MVARGRRVERSGFRSPSGPADARLHVRRTAERTWGADPGLCDLTCLPTFRLLTLGVGTRIIQGMDLRLQDEIKQRKPFGSLEQEATLNVVRTGAVLNDLLDQLVKPYGLSMPQYNVLRILRGAEPSALCRNEIRDRMVTRMPDMTRLLDRMEEAGLVARNRETDDRRLVLTRLTDEGHRLLDEIDPLVVAEHERRFGNLRREDLKTLIELLTTVRRNI